tara:strand:- start:10226 stop:10828 length:603 start_codon:yes stop_codon:yes gene_type:complete
MKESTAYINYNRIKGENDLVKFPKKFVNDKIIKPVKYEICLVKDIEDDDRNRFIRDELGRVYEETPIFDLWTVKESSEYAIEETFWIYGHTSRKDRKMFDEVLNVVFTNSKDATSNRQAIVVHNKLVVQNEDSFDMIICKNKKDCQRLHHALHDYSKYNKINGVIFMGTCGNANISMMYDIIVERTSWDIKKVRRTSTRP